tara:strand:+ start:265 stop:888 length:624 start_codon:yes stop_codon:yes gene_type:complete
MNYLQLCQRLVQETGIADSGPANTAGQVGDYGRIIFWINDAWLKIQSKRTNWHWMWAEGTGSLVADANTVTLPATVESIKRVSLGEGYLERLSFDEFADDYRVISAGNPSVYTVRPDGILLFNAKPTTTKTVTYQYYYVPTNLTTNTSIPGLPERYHMLIVYQALMSYALFDEAPELQRKAYDYFESMLGDLHRDQLPAITAPVSLA